jgi:hypothetical protein
LLSVLLATYFMSAKLLLIHNFFFRTPPLYCQLADGGFVLQDLPKGHSHELIEYFRSELVCSYMTIGAVDKEYIVFSVVSIGPVPKTFPDTLYCKQSRLYLYHREKKDKSKGYGGNHYDCDS